MQQIKKNKFIFTILYFVLILYVHLLYGSLKVGYQKYPRE